LLQDVAQGNIPAGADSDSDSSDDEGEELRDPMTWTIMCSARRRSSRSWMQGSRRRWRTWGRNGGNVSGNSAKR